MNNTNTLLVELCCEELPPKALQNLGNSFAENIYKSLQKNDLVNTDSAFTAYASPRRLSVIINNIRKVSPDKLVQQKLMPVKIAFENAENKKPSAALIKKLNTFNLNTENENLDNIISQLRIEKEMVFFDNTISGIDLAKGLQVAVENAISSLPIPKVMNYQLQDGWSSVQFVRPVHHLVALLDYEIIPISVLGLTANNITKGHRFECKTENNLIRINNANDYTKILSEQGKVIANFADRKNIIQQQLNDAAKEVANEVGEELFITEDDDLLNEVTALVEYPNVLVGTFEKEFLVVPQECLILTMKTNQKYFPLLNKNGKLSNKFLLVSNIKPADCSAIIDGNERVVRPRLSDARFFFEQDCKKTLESRGNLLSKVIYHNKLGNQQQRNNRVVEIAKNILNLPYFATIKQQNLTEEVIKATQLSKADLLTDMVGEFPELQGIMGRYYAQNDGLSDSIAFAIEDHYKPRFSGDDLPRNIVGKIVALADKLETITGLFGIGQLPTGDKDPFALRRHAIGISRLLSEKNNSLNLPLNDLLVIANNVFKSNISDAKEYSETNLKLLQNFIYERFAGILKDQGFTTNEIDSILSLQPSDLYNVYDKLNAVKEFKKLPEFEALVAANKRIYNILKKVDSKVLNLQELTINETLFSEVAEKDLYNILNEVATTSMQYYQQQDYTKSLIELAKLKNNIDIFFEKVMVNVDDINIKNNRLALLNSLFAVMNKIADLSKL